MSFLVLVVLCAAVCGRLAGGRFAAIGELPITNWRSLAAVPAVLLFGWVLTAVGLPAAVGALGMAGAGAAAIVFARQNRFVHGLELLAAGLFLNALVIIVNGSMPVSAHAAERAGISPARDVVDDQHELADRDSALRPLGDVIPVPLPVRAEVISPGDILIGAGLAQLAITAMLYAPPSRGRHTGGEAPTDPDGVEYRPEEPPREAPPAPRPFRADPVDATADLDPSDRAEPVPAATTGTQSGREDGGELLRVIKGGGR